ncbi:MAG: GntR family transcriptional regulator [Verrucomicrobiota bacterium]
MIPFPVEIDSSQPVYEQIGKAARRAMASGLLRAGDPFPSVRAISKDLRVNPNTIHKVVSKLIEDGLLEVVPGRGTFVSRDLPEKQEIRDSLLERHGSALAEEAKRLGMSKKDFARYCESIWRNLP